MKLLILGTDTKLFFEGSGVRTRSLAYARAFERYSVIVASTRHCHRDENEIGPQRNVSFISVFSPYAFYLFFKTVYRAYREAIHCDTISAQDPGAMGLIAFFVARIRKKRLHIQIHTEQKLSVVERFVIAKASKIRVVSKKIKCTIEPYATCAIDVLPVYIDATTYRNAKADLSLRTIVPHTEFLVLAMSRLEPEKNVMSIIDCIATVSSNVAGISLIVVGDGTQKERLQAYVREKKLQNIAFLPWTTYPETYYKTADLFMTLSAVEGYGLTIVESLLAGTPVLTTRVGIADEYIKSGYNSWIIDRPCEAAELLGEILHHPHAYQCVKEKLSETHIEMPNLSVYTQKLYETFL